MCNLIQHERPPNWAFPPPCFLVNYNCLISLWSSRSFSDWLLVTVHWQGCLEGVTAGCPAHEGRLHGNFDGLPLVHIKRGILRDSVSWIKLLWVYLVTTLYPDSLWNKICSWIFFFHPMAGQKRPPFSPLGIPKRERERSTGGAPAAPSLAPCAASRPSSFTPLYAAPPSYSSCFAPGLWCMANYQLLLGQAMSGRSGDCTTTATKQYTLWEELWSSVVYTAYARSRIRAPFAPWQPDPFEEKKKLNLKYDMQHLPRCRQTVRGRFATQMQDLVSGWFTLYCSSESSSLLSIWSIQDQITDPLLSIAPLKFFFLYFNSCLMLVISVLQNKCVEIEKNHKPIECSNENKNVTKRNLGKTFLNNGTLDEFQGFSSWPINLFSFLVLYLIRPF